jgi:hypothetical protein
MQRSEWYPLRIVSVGMLGLFFYLNWAGLALITLLVGQLLEIARGEWLARRQR